MRTPTAALAAALTLSFLARPVVGQGLAQKILSAPDGELRLSFATRPDVCGDGSHNIRSGRRVRVDDDDDGTWCPCENGPARVTLTVRDHRVTRVRVRVGGQWRTATTGSTDLGEVPVRAATTALLALAADPAQPGGRDAIFPATLADSVVLWPELLRLARDERMPHETRKQAVFWLSQAAADSATAGLADLAESQTTDRDIRTQAVFALSQRPKDEGVPVLIRVAQSNRDPEVRRSALFWLGQSEDPRALALFEELLVRK